MTIHVQRSNDGEIYIVLGERFDFGAVEHFRTAYESVEESVSRTLYIDFKNTRYMDSSALGMLLNAKTHLKDRVSKVGIVNCNDQIKKIFSISRFDQKFDIS